MRGGYNGWYQAIVTLSMHPTARCGVDTSDDTEASRIPDIAGPAFKRARALIRVSYRDARQVVYMYTHTAVAVRVLINALRAAPPMHSRHVLRAESRTACAECERVGERKRERSASPRDKRLISKRRDREARCCCPPLSFGRRSISVGPDKNSPGLK